MILDRRLYKNFDKGLFIAMLLLITVGIITIQSATQARGLPFGDSFVLRQLNSFAIGIILMLIVINVTYQKFIDMSYILYTINVILLLVVLMVGQARLGAQRWFSIGGFAFQPSEFIKLTLILTLASYAGSKKDTMYRLGSFMIPVLLLSMPFLLVLLQPDLGTALLLCPIFFAILIVGGVRMKYVAIMAALGLASLPFFWHFLREYQRQRLLVFINPNVDPLGAGYTIIQSKIAVGSGGLFGKGWLSGTQNQLNFLPERHTDFIFSVIGEEWGFLGSILLLLLFIFIIKKAFNIALCTNDMHGKLIAIGVGIMLSFQVIINISMTIGVMPVVGVPLPFVSYGGTSLMMNMVAIGLLLNISMRRSMF
ncbi:MAG: rod shape-determining protein RodA [Candidatus Omnitrophota bacterium]